LKIVITGGLGFIGKSLASALLALGHDVLLVDSLSVQVHGELPVTVAPEGARIARLDMRDIAEHAELLEACDAVFHLAAETGTAQSMYRIAHYVGVNEGGTAALLEAIARCTQRPRQVILASSRSVYGEGAYVRAHSPAQIVQPAPRRRADLEAGIWEPLDEQGQPLRAVPTPESLAFAPGSVYAATKASQELLLNSAADALGFRSTVFRFQNVYGEGQSLQNPYTGIISIFFNRARQGLDIPIYEDGVESRDFVHIADIVASLLTALDAELPSGAVINLGSGAPTSVLELASALVQAAGFEVPIRVTGRYRLGDIRHCYADLTRARRWLGYEPRIALPEGLRRFCTWAIGEAVYQDRSDVAAAESRAKGLSN
jgi:dTDP-L-rhamnose 4-epimerase